jgi:hypothetical protein
MLIPRSPITFADVSAWPIGPWTGAFPVGSTPHQLGQLDPPIAISIQFHQHPSRFMDFLFIQFPVIVPVQQVEQHGAVPGHRMERRAGAFPRTTFRTTRREFGPSRRSATTFWTTELRPTPRGRLGLCGRDQNRRRA